MKLSLPLTQITASNTAFVIPDEAVDALGGGRRPPVRATIAGQQLALRIAPMGGRNLLGLTKANKAMLGVEAGQTYQIELTLDTSERTVEVPDDLAAALAERPAARAAWDQLSFTRRKEAAASLTGAKKPETRSRRLTTLLESLDQS
ncbi:2-isopropylmalate synthase [Enemella evansiae]|uniref:2-isopropylmalate synthase n=1 Tax=Enemella evansiae TaxID=2016499 RepID=A0A255GF33_9ACTN|nr:YdeI/OmpD-associated family protein [Enemella evansiae]OYO06753.1 2-isopropylmalate synthase [Enemella evansiae]OYO11000.1 2-isopropylmalate synthase [Enemella evansiae]OYO12933.1 2-isopropylmalate synthase [Enemella evansiae]